MAIFKILIEIQNGIYDLWNLKSLFPSQEYNEKFNRIDYIIWMNKDAMILEFKDIKFTYPTEQERDEDLLRIKTVLDEHETAMILWDAEKLGKKKVYNKTEDLDDVSAEEIQDESDRIS